MTITVGSLFAGIGGLDLGLEWTGGFETIWQVEIDPYARRVLERHWPNARRYEDIQEVHGQEACPLADASTDGCGSGRSGRSDSGHTGQPEQPLCDSCLAPVDLICGGFPCQALSCAGKQAGLHAERSGLWWHMRRIVGELRPRYVLVENVPMLLARPEWAGAVLGSLAELGYDAEWTVLSALEYGAPHLRRRVFIVAYLADAISAGSQERSTQRGDVGQECATLERGGAPLADADRTRQAHAGESDSRQGRGARRNSPGGSSSPLRLSVSPQSPHWWATEPDVGRVASRIPARVDRLRCLGNAVVPACAQWIGERILAHADHA